jgi:hypothetical protein
MVSLLWAGSLAGGAAAGQFVVVESTTPGWLPGRVIEPGTPIALPAGAHVSLIGEDGRVTKLAGPYAGLPGAAAGDATDPTLVTALARLFTTGEPATSLLTGEDGLANPPDVWAIDIGRSGHVCVLAGTWPTLWRADAGLAQSLRVTQPATGEEAEVAFAAGVATAAWPAAVPAVDGATYALHQGGTGGTASIVLRLVPAGGRFHAASVAWMMQAGCPRQARALLAGPPVVPGAATTLVR